MARKILLLFIAIAGAGCSKQTDYKPSFTTVSTDTLLTDDISIRALTIDGDRVWYAGSNGKYGAVSLSGGKALNGVAAQDNFMPEFRAIAQTKSDIFILNAGTPALLYKISKDGKQNKVVYTEKGDRVFYDSMKFRNDKEGIAIGDPENECMAVIVTEDGGDTWKKVSCVRLPKVSRGEAAFAASNTNLEVDGDNTWIITGGKKSRVLHSMDKGKNWDVHDTPIVQGGEMTGMFSVDFYDDKIGFAVGGDYEKPNVKSANKILTTNGGLSWEKVGDGAGFGYASCVQFVPDSHGNELVTAGPAGIFYSYDRGTTWKLIFADKTLHTIRFADDRTLIAAGQNKILRMRLNK